MDPLSPHLRWGEELGGGRETVGGVPALANVSAITTVLLHVKKEKGPRCLLSTEILPTSWWLLVCNFMGFQRIKHCIIMFGY